MTTIKAFIKSRPVLIYFALTFVISWGCIFIVIGPGGFLGTKEIAEELLPFVYLATLAGPSVAGILLTGLIDGRVGFRELVYRLLRWRVGVQWYAVALLAAPILMIAILFALSLTSQVFLPAIVIADNKTSLLLTGIVMGLVVGFFEELGWTGFAVPRLRLRYGTLTTGLIVGILWGAWHFPLFSGSGSSSGALPQALYLAVLLFSFLPPYRVLMAWVYDRTGSLLVVILMHAPLAASQLILIPPTISGVHVVTYDLVFAAALWAFAVVVAVANGRQLEKESHRQIF
jgi:membrane protease YdiL (CAAX protease family)